MTFSADDVMASAMHLHHAGRLIEAEKIYRQVLQQNPRHAAALYLLGLMALTSGRPQRAADLISRSVRCNPDFPPAYCNLGIALAALNRPVEALAHYDAAIARAPDMFEAHANRGVLLGQMGRHEAAIESFDKALALRPNDATSLNDRGVALDALKRYAEALADFDQAIALAPDFADAHLHRGNTLTRMKRSAEALASFDAALARRPDLAAACCNRGDALHELNRPDEALASFDKALALQPDLAEAHFGRALSLLLTGRYAEGFREYEWRHRRVNVPRARSFRQPLWLGKTSLSGRTILIHPELFLGDMIQFCRYAKLAAAQGGRVILAAQEPLRPLLQSLGADITVIGENETPRRFDCHCPLMSLPLAFATTLQTVPAAVPYLHADPDKIAVWKQRIGDHGRKVGICWQGSATSTEMDRSFPVTVFNRLSRLPDLRLISVQTGPGREQLSSLPEGMRVESFDDAADTGLRPFAESAALLANLDLVISTDTAIAHLAGAMGRPTWIALKHVPDWRWGQVGDTTPWYPTVKLFRQTTSGDWDGVFADIMTALTIQGNAA